MAKTPSGLLLQPEVSSPSLRPSRCPLNRPLNSPHTSEDHSLQQEETQQLQHHPASGAAAAAAAEGQDEGQAALLVLVVFEQRRRAVAKTEGRRPTQSATRTASLGPDSWMGLQAAKEPHFVGCVAAMALAQLG